MIPGVQIGGALVSAFVLPGNLIALGAGAALAAFSPLPGAGFVVLGVAEAVWLGAAVFGAHRDVPAAEGRPRPPAVDLIGRLEVEARDRLGRVARAVDALADSGADAQVLDRALWAILRAEVALQEIATRRATTDPAEVLRTRAELRRRLREVDDPGSTLGLGFAQAIRIADTRMTTYRAAAALLAGLGAATTSLAGALDALAAAPRASGPVLEAVARLEARLADLPVAVGPAAPPAGLLGTLLHLPVLG